MQRELTLKWQALKSLGWLEFEDKFLFLILWFLTGSFYSCVCWVQNCELFKASGWLSIHCVVGIEGGGVEEWKVGTGLDVGL